MLGKSCRFGFPLVLFLFYAVFIVCVPFPFGIWEIIACLEYAFRNPVVEYEDGVSKWILQH